MGRFWPAALIADRLAGVDPGERVGQSRDLQWGGPPSCPQPSKSQSGKRLVQTLGLSVTMKIPGLRHSAEQTGGMVFFGRMLDKIRLHAQGKLPTDYKRGTNTDARVCRFLHVDYSAIEQKVLAGESDEEILEWCFETGHRPNDEEILMFNAYLSKRGWRDAETPKLDEMKRARGFGHRTDIQTLFDFHKADEAED